VNHQLQVTCTKAQAQQVLDNIKQKGSQTRSVVGASKDAPAADVDYCHLKTEVALLGERQSL
jgi:hypothetical protein